MNTAPRSPAFPSDLAAFVVRHWESDAHAEHYGWTSAHAADPLPPPEMLDHILATCYQASLLREESRPVRLRLIARDPERFSPREGPPDGLHRLLFATPRSFDERELRRLFPATNFYRSLVGVSLDVEGAPFIWGQIHSGVNWIEAIEGAQRRFVRLPDSLVVSILGPGRITVGKGSQTIARLVGGRITSPAVEVAESEWVREAFADTEAAIWRLHAAAQEASGEHWAPLDPGFARIIGRRAVKQIISAIRNSNHGGTLLLFPQALAKEAGRPNRFLSLKYAFADEEPRRRLRTLIVQLLNGLARSFAGSSDPARAVGWAEYLSCVDPEIARIEEAIVECSRYIAGLAAVDGAVVMTSQYELLGFGGEISGELGSVASISRALDAEGSELAEAATDGFGTRHRSAYRLCGALHDVVAIVISQDGGVRSIKWKDGAVTSWDQLATSTLDL